MEGRNEPVIGYPPEFLRRQSGYQLSGCSRVQPSYPTPTTTTTIRTAYPYTMQTPPQTRRAPKRNNCLHALVILVITALVIAGTFAFKAIASRPRPLKFHVESLTVSPFNVTTSHITANWKISFSVINPNNMIFFYEQVEASVFYKEYCLSYTTMEPFYQDEEEQRLVRASIAVSLEYNNNSVENAIAGDRAHGAVDFTMNVDGWVRLISGSWQGRRQWMSVSCKDVKVVFSASTTAGTMLGGPRACKVHL